MLNIKLHDFEDTSSLEAATLVNQQELDRIKAFFTKELKSPADPLISKVRSGDKIYEKNLLVKNTYSSEYFKQLIRNKVQEGVILSKTNVFSAASLIIVDKSSEEILKDKAVLIDCINAYIISLPTEYSYYRKIPLKGYRGAPKGFQILNEKTLDNENIYVKTSLNEIKENGYFKFPSETTIKAYKLDFSNNAEDICKTYIDNIVLLLLRKHNKEFSEINFPKYITQFDFYNSVTNRSKKLDYSDYKNIEILLSNNITQELGMKEWIECDHNDSTTENILSIIVWKNEQ